MKLTAKDASPTTTLESSSKWFTSMSLDMAGYFDVGTMEWGLRTIECWASDSILQARTA